MNDMNENDNTTAAGDAAPADETFGWTDPDGDSDASGGPAQAAREIVSQIHAAVGSVAEKAGPVARDLQAKAAPVAHDLVERAKPVARELGARAAGIAAVAGDKAGPIAQKAAEMTAEAGVKFAEKSRHVADDLRHAASGTEAADAPAGEDKTSA